MTKLTDLPAWKLLQEHFENTKDDQMRDMFANDSKRFDCFSLKLNDILFDYSKNRIHKETMSLLLQLAEEADVVGCRERLFSGYPINFTEHRAVMHTALRAQSSVACYADNERIDDEIETELGRIKALAEKIRSRQWLGHRNQPITDIVNIGIGGSHLGPLMVTEALHPYAIHDLKFHFISNVDENHITKELESLNPDTTLFIISSKSFTTQETMVNAATARQWLLRKIDSESDLSKHLIAVTSKNELAIEFGVSADNIFKMWDWVGGRYSVWSAIGLPIVIAIGPERFDQFLEGAHEADEHFKTMPLEDNIPVIMALIGVWYNNFYKSESLAVLPYDQNMSYFPAYLQQADMESNGKSCDRDGNTVDYTTGPIIFGEIGIQAQHAFYQLLHQGTKMVPADILAPISNFLCIKGHHRALMSNVFAQAESLMKGKTASEARVDMQKQGLSEDEIEKLLPYKVFSGNRPTNTFLFYTLDPKTLGSLIALYEHKIFVQGVIWNLNSFDQWGVELGKVMAKEILDEINQADQVHKHDCSTNGLINYYLDLKGSK